MSLIVLCGNPCSGKTTICQKLAQQLKPFYSTVTVINPETTLGLDKNEAYRDSVSHKNTRSGLRSAVERALSNRSTAVLLDALNNIKGCRYEIWCLARTAAVKYCLVHVDASEELCRERNSHSSQSYQPEILEDLLSSFERPDSKNRWDAPLFTVKTDQEDGTEETVLASVVESICGESQKGRTQVTSLTPTDATSNPRLAETNLQHDIDRAANDIVAHLTKVQSEVGSEAVGTVIFAPDLPTLHLDRHITVTELRRLKRGFLKLATQVLNSRITDSEAARRLFIEYLDQNLTK